MNTIRTASLNANVGSLGDLTAKLFRVFSSRRFMRRPLRPTPDARRIVVRAWLQQAPIPVVYLWGRGKKPLPDLAEDQAVGFLADLQGQVTRIWRPGLSYTILFCDTHAAVNGLDAGETTAYFGEVRRLLGSIGADTCRISKLWQDGNLTWDTVSSASRSVSPSVWRCLDERLHLEFSARKHVDSGSPQQAARLYLALRLAEARILEKRFAHSFYATSDSPERSPLFPDLPVLYLYSRCRGRCAKPWFESMPRTEVVTKRYA